MNKPKNYPSTKRFMLGPKSFPDIIIAQITLLRLTTALSSNEIAEAIGVGRRTVGRYVSGLPQGAGWDYRRRHERAADLARGRDAPLARIKQAMAMRDPNFRIDRSIALRKKWRENRADMLAKYNPPTAKAHAALMNKHKKWLSSWCPPEYFETYKFLTRVKRLKSLEAMKIIATEIERKCAKPARREQCHTVSK